MSNTKGTTVPPTFTEAAEALASRQDIGGLADLAAKASGLDELRYAVGLAMMATEAAKQGDIDARIARYSNTGRILHAMVREAVNTGQVKDTKGTVRPVLASTEAVTFAMVKDALGVREAGETWSPPIVGAKPVGRTECQRFWEAATLSETEISKAKAALVSVKGEPSDNAKAIVERAAAFGREATLTPAEVTAKAAKATEREQAKAAKAKAAERRTERQAEATKAAEQATPLLTEAEAEAATIPTVFATIGVLLARVEAWHVAEEAAEAEAAKLADLLATLGFNSIDELREAREAAKAAKAEAVTAE